MNALTKACAVLSLMTGFTFAALPAPAITLPAPAPAQAALTTLLAQPDGPLPTGTRLLSVRLADGLATVNFSHEMRDNFPGGDSAETRAVNSVLRTLGQFPTITRAQLLVEGKPIDSLGGLLELTNPLPVLRPAEASPVTGHPSLHRRLPPPSSAKPEPRETTTHVS